MSIEIELYRLNAYNPPAYSLVLTEGNGEGGHRIGPKLSTYSPELLRTFKLDAVDEKELRRLLAIPREDETT